MEAKRRNKIKVASFLKERTGYDVSPNAMFDVQVGFLPPSTSFLSSPGPVNIFIKGGTNSVRNVFMSGVFIFTFLEEWILVLA